MKRLLQGLGALLLLGLLLVAPGLFGCASSSHRQQAQAARGQAAPAASRQTDQAPSRQTAAKGGLGKLTITLLDVGHGDAILLQDGRQNVMIDVGHPSGWQDLQKHLAQRQVGKVDRVFVTHHHSDHMGNILKFLPKYKVGRVYDNGGSNSGNKTSLKLRNILDEGGYGYKKGGSLKAGDRVELGPAYYLEVFAPGNFLNNFLSKKDLKDLNNTSLVMKLHYGSFTMLFTGDAEAPVEDALQRRLDGQALKSDVLKVGHHGSRTSSYYPFISKVRPAYALISCGNYEKYHHPNKNVVDRLQHLGAKVWNTHKHGCLTVVTDGEKYEVSKEK